jgi:hypothetical protein
MLLLLMALSVSAEEPGESDFELDFLINTRSTIGDFPLQEIDQDALSNAVIEGALKSTSAGIGPVAGKPAYTELGEQEARSKNEQLLVEVESGSLNASEFLDLANIPDAPPPQIELPAYQEPNGRHYDHHQTWTVER